MNTSETSGQAYRRPKTHKERMHLDLESDDVEAEV
jgi:hypothetical protein